MGFPLKLNAIVLQSVNYRDHDRMLTLFTREQGRVEASARGAHKTGSRYMAASTQFAMGEYLLRESGGRYTLAGCTLDSAHYAIRETPTRLACAALLARLCLETVQEGEPNEPLFLTLLQALAYLENGYEDLKGLAAGFLLRFLHLNGQGVVLDRCVQCGGPLKDARFDYMKGGLACAEHATPGSLPATREQVFALRRALQGDRFRPVESVPGCYEALRGFTEYQLDRRFSAFDYFENLL